MKPRSLSHNEAEEARRQYHLGRAYRPKAIAARLGISTTTLRQYVNRKHVEQRV